MTALLDSLLTLVVDEIPAAVEFRRMLHSVPELGGEEHRTVGLVAEQLPVQGTSFFGTGMLASLGHPTAGAVWVRAELDGLRVAEQTGVSFAAQNGSMHACGHDVHVAALTALVRAAHRIRSELPARLVAVFQPSEERSPSGAVALTSDPVLAEGVKAAVAAHLHPDLPWGSIGAEAGTVNAAADAAHIVVTGQGGHAAYPHLAADPVLALAHVVVGLHGLVGRQVDPTHPATLTVGCVRGGLAENVIPGAAEALATFRSFDPNDQQRLRDAVTQLVSHVAAANGCAASIAFVKSEPPMVNDARLAALVRAHARRAGLSIAQPWRSCGGDDFAHYGAVCPALMVFVGLQGAPGFRHTPLHRADFLPPEESVAAVARALALAYYAGAAVAAGE